MNRTFLPIVIIFVIVLAGALIFQDMLEGWKINSHVIINGNLLLFAVTFNSWLFHKRALVAGNTHSFMRNLYGGMMIRMLVCIIALFIYVALAAHVNKPAIFVVMFLYLVYTFTEIAVLLKYSKRIKNV